MLPLVEVSLPTVMQLNEVIDRFTDMRCVTAHWAPRHRSPRNRSMVAISGLIMLEPLAILVTSRSCPPQPPVREGQMGTVSVVMMALAATASGPPSEIKIGRDDRQGNA